MGRHTDCGLGASLLLHNYFMTVLKTKKFTAFRECFLQALTFLALMYLPGDVLYKSMVKDQFWWWWVVHLWVEGSWEIIAGALLAFMLHKLLGADVKVLAKWMYIEVGLVLFTGASWLGHHYYWIGTPEILALGRRDFQLAPADSIATDGLGRSE